MPKTMNLRFPRASCSLRFPFKLPFILDAYFWSVVVWRPRFRPNLYFFVIPFCGPKRLGQHPPPRDPTRLCLLFNCYVLPFNGDHLRTRPHLPLYFLIGLALVPQTREPTAALPYLTAHTLRKPTWSGGTMSCWCCWPNHGGRGLRPVEGRVAWLMLVVVWCCCQLLYRIVDKTTYVEVYGRLCIRTLVQKEERGNVGHPRHENDVSGSVLCLQNRAMSAKSANIWLSGGHVANMLATFPAKASGSNSGSRDGYGGNGGGNSSSGSNSQQWQLRQLW